MKVRDIMTAGVATATPETTLEDIATMIRDEHTGAIPVLDDELVGIVTDRDIVIRCIAEGKDPVETTVEDVLSESLETIAPDADVEEARDLMSRRQIRRLPVVEDGKLMGMLSIGDIAVKSDTDVGATLENVSEGVKASGAVAKRATVAGTVRAGGEAVVRDIGVARKKAARGATGGEEGRQDGRREQGPGTHAASGRGQVEGIANRSRAEEQRGQTRVVRKRSQARTGTRRRAS